MTDVNKGTASEIEKVRKIAASDNDSPVLMLNLNLYSAAAEFPNGALYRRYMHVLEGFLPVVGAKILWRHQVHGQVMGDSPINEVLAAWYPSHQAFLELRHAPGSEENFRLRELAVEQSSIHRLSGDQYPFVPE